MTPSFATGISALDLTPKWGASAAAQIIVTAHTALTGVTMSASPLIDGAGHIISADHISFFREASIDFANISVTAHGNLEVPQHSPSGDSRIPDPLIPFLDPYTTPARAVGAPFNVAAGLNQPVWVDVFIPKDTLAGVYQAVITVSLSGQSPVAVPLTLTVWEWVLAQGCFMIS